MWWLYEIKFINCFFLKLLIIAKDTVGKYYSGPYQKPAEDFAKNILGLQDIPSMSPSLANKLGLSSGGGGSRRGAFGSGMFGRDRSPSYSSGL